jgi:ribosomal protein L4
MTVLQFLKDGGIKNPDKKALSEIGMKASEIVKKSGTPLQKVEQVENGETMMVNDYPQEMDVVLSDIAFFYYQSLNSAK